MKNAYKNAIKFDFVAFFVYCNNFLDVEKISSKSTTNLCIFTVQSINIFFYYANFMLLCWFANHNKIPTF